MKAPPWRGLHAWTMSVGLAFLAGCNTEPNANFEKALQAQNAKQQKNDPSGELFRVLPGQDRYLQLKPDERRLRAQQFALNVRGRFEPALKSFEVGLKVSGLDSLLATCRPAFTLALDLQSSSGAESRALLDQVTETARRLTLCREQSLAAEKANGGERADAAGALKRFASTAIVMTGLATIGHGEEQAGLDLWGRGYEFAAKDQPGFKMSWRTFFQQQ